MTEAAEDVEALRAELRDGGVPALQFLDLWRTTREVRFFAKSPKGRFLAVSPNLLDLNGLRREEDMLGLTDHDLYPSSIAEKFVQDDAGVVRSASPLTDILEIFLDDRGAPDWYVTQKFPLRGRGGRILGVMGTSRRYGAAEAEANPYPSLHRAIRHMQARFADELTVPDLAERVRLSVRQFQREFRRHFRTTPSAYLIRMRVLAACDLLRDGDRQVAEIAAAVGFGDESHFIRQFRSHMGVTPGRYRAARRG